MYQTTTASGIADLIDKLAAAFTSAGWTVLRNTLDGGAIRTITVKKSGDYIHIWNDANNISIGGSTGYDGAQPWTGQPGKSAYGAACNVGPGPYPNVLFFADNSPAEHLFAVVEVSAGRFRHLGFGQLEKVGAYTGGTFYDATWWRNDGDNAGAHDAFSPYNHRMFDSGSANAGTIGGSVRCDIDGLVDAFLPFTGRDQSAIPVVSGGLGFESTGSSYNNGESIRAISGFYSRSINSWSAQTPLQRIQVRAERAGGYWSVIGEVPNIRFINMARFAPGDEFTIGTDVWKVFPFIRQGDSPANLFQQYSQNAAYAYKKVA